MQSAVIKKEYFHPYMTTTKILHFYQCRVKRTWYH